MTTPLKFALVPVEPAPVMFEKDKAVCYAAMPVASPGNDLLERIVRARDAVTFHMGHDCDDLKDMTKQLLILLSELGDGHG